MYTREILHKRHRLSHQQIDRWLGENRSKDFFQEKMRHLKMVQNFISITDLLRQNDIAFCCLKGPLLSQRIYNDPAVRYSHDIDILIDQEDLEVIINILLSNGYHFAAGVFWPENKIQQELLIKNAHDISFINKESGFYVEMHWTLMHTLPISTKKIKSVILENKEDIIFAGRKFTVLTPELELVYLMIHGSRHRWERLKWLVDIHEYPFDKIDPIKWKSLIQLFKAERIINQTNLLLIQYFDKKLPNTTVPTQSNYFTKIALQTIESDFSVQKNNREILQIYINYWLMFPGIFHKYQILTSTLFRPEDILNYSLSYKISYYLFRPYSFIKRRIFHA
jgi:hypothetical protein